MPGMPDLRESRRSRRGRRISAPAFPRTRPRASQALLQQRRRIGVHPLPVPGDVRRDPVDQVRQRHDPVSELPGGRGRGLPGLGRRRAAPPAPRSARAAWRAPAGRDWPRRRPAAARPSPSPAPTGSRSRSAAGRCGLLHRLLRPAVSWYRSAFPSGSMPRCTHPCRSTAAIPPPGHVRRRRPRPRPRAGAARSSPIIAVSDCPSMTCPSPSRAAISAKCERVPRPQQRHRRVRLRLALNS